MDAAISSYRNASYFGSLLRDGNGSFIAADGGHFMGYFAPKIAEAMAFSEALSWVKSKNMVNVNFELDSLRVVKAIRWRGINISYIGSIIEDCSSILKDLMSHSILFVKRSANMAAHRIVRETISMSDRK